MKIVKAFRIAAVAVLLPAVGVAVAATARFAEDAPVSDSGLLGRSSALQGESEGLTGTLPLPKWERDLKDTDGRQDPGTRSNYVWLDETGTVNGAVSSMDATGETKPVANMPLSVMRSGLEIQQVSTDEVGQFQLTNVKPGIYSLVGRSEEAVVSLAFYALPAAQVAEDFRQVSVSRAQELQIDVLAVSAENMAGLDQLMRQELPSISLGDDASPEETYAKVSRMSFHQVSASKPVRISEIAEAVNPELRASTSLQHHPVLIRDRGLSGDLVQIFGSPVNFMTMRVCLLKDGQIVNEAVIDDAGHFRFENVGPGVYGFAAAGVGGFAAVTIEATEEAAEESTAIVDDVHYVAHRMVASKKASKRAVANLSIALVMQEDAGAAGPGAGAGSDDDDGGAAFGGGGGPAGGGGGGGGGGGLFGGGAFLPLAGAAAGITALATDDDGNQEFFRQPSPFGVE